MLGQRCSCCSLSQPLALPASTGEGSNGGENWVTIYGRSWVCLGWVCFLSRNKPSSLIIKFYALVALMRWRYYGRPVGLILFGSFVVINWSIAPLNHTIPLLLFKRGVNISISVTYSKYVICWTLILFSLRCGSVSWPFRFLSVGPYLLVKAELLNFDLV